MSVHVIYYKDGAKMMRPVLSREEYLQIRDTQKQRLILAAVRKGCVEQKGQLVQMNYSCLPNGDGSLKGSRTMSTTVGMDIDHIKAEEMLAVKERILGKREELGLLMLELSARGQGYHLVFRRRQELSQEENLRWASELLGVEFDKGAKDITRVFFTTTADDGELLFLDDAVFEVQKEDVRGKKEDVRGKKEEVTQHTSDISPLTSNVSERTRFIAEGVLKEKQLEAQDFLDEGGRHTTVKIFLSGVTQLLKKEEVNGLLRELMPEHWADENIQQLVNDFYANYTKPSQRLMKYQEELFAKSRRIEAPSILPRLGETTGETGLPLLSEGAGGGLPPTMPNKLPKLVALLTSKTPAMYKAAVAHAVFPPLATHLCGVRFTYTDNVEHEATLMNCLMAGTGSGKGCIDEPISHIMADIERRDAENTRRESEWKKDCQKKGANKDKLLRPEGLVIQIIDPDMTKPALVTRMEEAEGHFVYVKLNELDLFEQLKGQTGKQHFQLMCLAFDPGATYGQTRVGTQSVTARPQCRFNWNACTTLLKGRRFFRKVLTDGPISRINFCTIPENEIGVEQPIYGQYDAAFDEQLKPYIDNLVAARGLIDCPQAHRLAKRLLAECAEFARLSQNDTYWNLSHRACVIAWLKACVLYVANGQKWERSIEDFVRWSLEYDLWCKMQFFGAEIDKANRGDDSRIGTRGPRNLLELLPDEFTLEDAKRVRRQEGHDVSDRETAHMIRTWKARGYCAQSTEHSFIKLKYRSTAHS